MTPDDQGQGRGSRGGFFTTLPGILTGVAAVITATGTLIGVLVSQSGGSSHNGPTTTPAGQTSPSATSTAATSTAAGSFRGFVLAKPKLPVRATASTSGGTVGELPFHQTVIIVCTKIGDAVSGPGGITSPLWDRVRTEASTEPIGFVPDALVDTGTANAVAPSC